MTDEMKPENADGIPGWGGFEFGRRLALKAAGAIAASGAIVSLADVSAAHAASKSSTIKIGYVSPRTGALADFAGPDNFVLQEIRKSSYFAKGITIGKTKYKIEITEKDTQSLGNIAVQVTQELINSGVDLILVSSAPETTIPVATTCEQYKIPCVSTVVPWEAYWGGFSGATITAQGGAGGTGPIYNSMFFFGIPQFVGTFVPMWKRVQAQTKCNSNVAEMYPNDSDGNAFRAAFAPTVGAIYPSGGYNFVDGGAYTDLSTDYTSMIQTFKTGGKGGASCDLFINCPLPPDFQTFWTQASQQNYNPKLATVAKVMLFPTDAYALGDLSNNIATDAWFTPYSPYKSSLTGMTASKFCTAYQNENGGKNGQWVQSMGSTYSLFEIAIQGLKRVTNPHNRLALAKALQTVSYDGMCGPINMNSKSKDPMVASPAKGIAMIQPVGVQWKPGSTDLVGHKKYAWSQVVVDNSLNKHIPLNGTLEPTNA
ncbi:MAG TPA: ABC transporter substrate-binding protein [Acidimicrobiales bacterium]